MKLTEPSGTADEYIKDNAITTTFDAPEELRKTVIFYFRTNRQPQQNAWELTDSKGQVVKQRGFTAMKPETEYRDTLRLMPGCYKLSVADTAGDGLEFWYNSDAGRGVARLMDTSGVMLKNFESDFGSGFQYCFTVPAKEGVPVPPLNEPVIGLFPLRTSGKTTLDYFSNVSAEVKVQITTENGSPVKDFSYPSLKEGVFTYDLTGQPAGRYYLKVTAGDKTISKRFRITEPEK